jgi:hypothetical protein
VPGQVEEGLRRILQFPRLWPIYEGKFRRYLLKRFPCGLIYRIDPEKIFIAGSGTDPHRDYVTRSQWVLNRRLKETTGWALWDASVVEGWPSMVAQVEGTR